MVMDDKMGFEQLLADTKSKARRAMVNSGVSLASGEVDLLLSIMDNAIKTWKIEMEIAVPKSTPSLSTISCLRNKVVGWHPVDGVRRQIVQITKDDKVYYYTDGIEEKI